LRHRGSAAFDQPSSFLCGELFELLFLALALLSRLIIRLLIAPNLSVARGVLLNRPADSLPAPPRLGFIIIRPARRNPLFIAPPG
jgi:hypothetical protein